MRKRKDFTLKTHIEWMAEWIEEEKRKGGSNASVAEWRAVHFLVGSLQREYPELSKRIERALLAEVKP